MPGPVFAINQQNVGPAVVVVIDEGTTGAHGFGEIFLPECAVVMDEVDAGLGGDVTKVDLLGLSRDSNKWDYKQLRDFRAQHRLSFSDGPGTDKPTAEKLGKADSS